jgi:solute:Na+ symporter, SSS family
VVIFAVLVLTIALTSNSSIYQLVVNTYKVTLVAAFVPLCAGLFWSRATTQGALCAFVAGLITWLGLELFGPSDSIWPPQLVGFLMAATGMVAGSLLPQQIGARDMRDRRDERER